jgi:hypothetical protein
LSECPFVECTYAECIDAKCAHAECAILSVLMLIMLMLSMLILSVLMLRIVATFYRFATGALSLYQPNVWPTSSSPTKLTQNDKSGVTGIWS